MSMLITSTNEYGYHAATILVGVVVFVLMSQQYVFLFMLIGLKMLTNRMLMIFIAEGRDVSFSGIPEQMASVF